MALLSLEEVRRYVRQRSLESGMQGIEDYVEAALTEESAHFSEEEQVFDIFLSHSYLDKMIVLGTKQILENEYGYSVYVDWIIDLDLNRSNTTPDTAKRIKDRMRNCRCLFYATSDNAIISKWMPWETGVMDGMKGRVAILPLTDGSSDSYKGREYLGLYPYVSFDSSTKWYAQTLFINERKNVYVEFDEWLNGDDPVYHSD